MSTTTLDLSRVDTIVTEDPDRPLTPIPLGLVEQELATMKLTIALQTTKALNQLRAFLLNVASGGVRRVTGIAHPDFETSPTSVGLRTPHGQMQRGLQNTAVSNQSAYVVITK